MTPARPHHWVILAALLLASSTAMTDSADTAGGKTGPAGRVLASDDGTREACYALQALPAPTGKNTIRKKFHIDSLAGVRSARIKLYAVLTDFTTKSEFDFEHWEWIFFTLNGHDWVVRPMDLPLARNGACWSNWSNARWGSVAVPDVRWLREGENELVLWCNNLDTKPHNKYLEIGIDTDATTQNSEAKYKDGWSATHLRGETGTPEKRHTYPLPQSGGEEVTGEYMIRLELLSVPPEVAKRQSLVTDDDLKQAIANGASWLVGLAESTEKICPQKPFDAHHPTDWTIDLAGGEYESMQLVLWALTKPLTDVAIEVKLDVPGLSADLFRVGYVRCNSELWPDPLWPMQGPLKDIPADSTQPILVRFHATPAAKPGTHECTIRITPAGEKPREFPGTITVHPFDLPKASSLPLGISLDYRVPSHTRLIDEYRMTMLNVADGAVGVPTMTLHEDGTVTADWDEWKQRVKAYFKEGQHRILCLGWITQPQWIGGTLHREMTIAGTDTRRKVSLDPRNGADEEKRFATIMRGYQKALTELGVVDRCCFYVEDEPHTRPEHAAKMAGDFKQYAPAIRRLVTCSLIDPAWIDRFDLFVIHGNAFPRNAQEVTRPDDQLWLYTCNDLARPPATIPHDAAMMRAWPWYANRYPRITGLLYWAVSWQSPIEPDKVKDIKQWGDGTWFYTLPDGRALPSLRAEAMRDGLEDYEYLLRLRGIDTPSARKLTEQAHQIVPKAFAYPTDTGRLRTVRRAIAEALTPSPPCQNNNNNNKP